MEELTLKMPDFLILGAQKAGTTSLFHYLKQHPDIQMSTRKEVHFFDKNFEKGIENYGEFFNAENSSAKIKGEATPYYFFHPCVPERVFKYLPLVKLIVLLRNPADRTYAQYYHEIRIKKETIMDFWEAISMEDKRLENAEDQLLNGFIDFHYSHQHHSYITRSLYSDQIQRWLRFFPKSQFLFIKSETFFSDPKSQLSKVYEFLDIPMIFPDNLAVFNENHYPPMAKETREKLNLIFAEEFVN